jgi:large subunit ribosomal protein L18
MKNKKLQSRLNRKRRIRRKIFGTAEVPRLTVFRSLTHMYAQIINDNEGVTLKASYTVEKEVKKRKKKTGTCDTAKIIGEDIGEKALQKGIKKVVFDRNGFIYNGRIKALAVGAREKGLQF